MIGVQIRLAGLPLDPVELAKVPIFERAKLYAELDLDPIQRQVAEEAVRLIIASESCGVGDDLDARAARSTAGVHRALPKPADDPASHRKAVRWIGRKVPGSIDRGRAARRRWAGVSDDLLSDARREIAGAIRAVDEVPDQVADPLRNRPLLIELAEPANAVRELVVEVEAIGLTVEVER